MKLAILGGTGTVGSALVSQALDAGHQVRLLARTPSKVTRSHRRLTVVAGDARDDAGVSETIAGSDAALSALGGVGDSDSIRIGTAAIDAAMRTGGVRRLIVMQGFHLDFPGDPRNAGRTVVLPLLWLASRDLIADSSAMASQVQASTLDWTVVRAPRVVAGPRSGRYRTGILELGPWNRVTNSDVAEFMLRCLDDATTIGTAPMIAAGTRRSTHRIAEVRAGR